MEFNKSNIGQIAVALIAVVITGCDKSAQQPAPVAAINDSSITFVTPKPAVFDDNDATFKRMTEQIEKDRRQQRRIKDLKMQREETDLELEEQKALSELNKFKKDNVGSVNDGNFPGDSNMDIKIVYLGGTDTQKEAILSINGTNYSVKNKEKPLKNMEVQSITNNDVTIRFLTPVDTTTTYQFKSE